MKINRLFSQAKDEHTLSASEIARFSNMPENKLEIWESIDSTNTRAKMLADENREICCVLADTQTAGRGKNGRHFFSPPGAGLYMSIILRTALSPDVCMLLTPYAAVAVVSALRAISPAEPGIKWVNDIYLHGKKVCGILTEPVFSQKKEILSYAIIGIGINIKKQTFPPELSAIASSVENEYSCQINRNRLAGEILRRLQNPSAQQLKDCLPAYRKDQILLGKKITVYRGNEVFPATALGITEEGALLVQTETDTFPVFCGEVTIRPES